MTFRIITLTAGLSLLSLAGCAAQSVKGMREREPVLTAESSRTVEQITQCASAAWIDLGVTPKTVARTGGTSLVHEAGVVLAVLDIDQRPTGAHVELRIFKSIWAKQNRKWIADTRACL